MKIRPAKGPILAGCRRLPRLPYLVLAHHTDVQAGRTIGLRLLNWEQRFCTRCSGQWLGVLACVAAMVVYPVAIALPIWCGVLILSPAPALLDWITQTWKIRESRTWLRLLTGFILGTGVGFQVIAAVKLDWLRFGIGIGVFCGYMVVIYLLLKARPASSSYMVDLVEEVTQALDSRRSS